METTDLIKGILHKSGIKLPQYIIRQYAAYDHIWIETPTTNSHDRLYVAVVKLQNDQLEIKTDNETRDNTTPKLIPLADPQLFNQVKKQIDDFRQLALSGIEGKCAT